MKIYCKEQLHESNPYKYIGRDVWIHVLYGADYAWVKFKDSGKDENGYYFIVDYVDDQWLENPECNIEIEMDHDAKWYTHHMCISNPVEILTTEELLARDYDAYI